MVAYIIRSDGNLWTFVSFLIRYHSLHPYDVTLTQLSENDSELVDAPREPVLITIVIVNFNAGPYLRAAIDSIVAQDVDGDRVEVVVIDNDSTAPGLAEIEADYSAAADLTIVALDHNIGFARACNIGLQTGRGDLVLLMNPDCRLLPGALAAMRDALLEKEHAGIAGARLINPDGSEQRGARRNIPNPWLIFCEVLQLHRLMPDHPRFRSFNRHMEALPKEAAVVPAVSGACMMVKRQAVGEVGLLDGDYFMHFEDLDWCLRFDQARWQVLFVPDATVEHTKGVCTATIPIRVAYEKHRSLMHFLRKHFTAYYPSSFMALVSVLVTTRFVLLAPRVWLRARVAQSRRPRTGVRVPVVRR